MSSTDLSARFLSYLAEVAQATEARLRAQVDGVPGDAARASAFSGDAVRRALGLALRGGKRLRPALVGLGYRVAGGRTPDAVHGAFAAVELLHASYLVHDDIADGDRLRRGGPALHVELEALTETVRDAESSAILAGDWLAGLAFAEMASCPVEAVGLVGAVRELADQVLRVNVGQLDDVRSTGVSGRDELERMYENKTASYSTRGPLRLGALLAGAPAARVDAIGQVGVPLGVAFQLADDCLGWVGDPAVTGKPAGTSSKFERAASAYGVAGRAPDEAVAALRARAHELYDHARAQVDALEGTEDARALLRGCVDVLEQRTT